MSNTPECFFITIRNLGNENLRKYCESGGKLRGLAILLCCEVGTWRKLKESFNPLFCGVGNG